MKLLRLISNTETEADFVAMFQEPITIPPNSKICLQNFSIFLNDSIEVTADNRVITMKSTVLTTGEEIVFSQAFLTIGTYDFQSFITELERAFNVGLNNPLGIFAQIANLMEVSVKIDVANRIVISYALANPTLNDNLTNSGIIYDGAGNYSKDGTLDPTVWAFTYGNQGANLTKGQMLMEVINRADLGSLDGVEVGIAPWADFTEKVDINDFRPADYTVCVWTNAATGTYWRKTRSGANQNTTVAYEDADRIQFGQGATNDTEIDQAFATKFIIQVQRYDTGNIVVLHEETSVFNEKLHFGVSILNDENQVSDIQFVQSQDGGQATPPEAPYEKFKLYFSKGSQNLLGFNSPQSTQITGPSGEWVATNTIYANMIPTSLIIEIPTLPLASYDSEIDFQRRRSILAVLPTISLNIVNDSIAYSAPFPVFIDINNRNTELLNTIRVRVLDTEDNPLQLATEVPRACSLSVILD
jgi:hypothetical protein